MIIEIKDMPQGLKRVVLEFDDLDNENTGKTAKKIAVPRKSKDTKEPEDTKESNNNEVPIDLNFGQTPSLDEISQIEKPVIEEKKRTTKISGTMQNLKI